MRAYVGVTDQRWFEFLEARPVLDQVNFWRPGGDREFRVLAPGEPFFFKTHYPHNKVVGGGLFSGFAPLRLSEAWELFGEGNGVDSLAGMRRLVGRYRKQPIAPAEDPTIGCIFIRDTTFFRSDEPAAPPPGLASNVLQGKGYDLADPAVSWYFGGLLARLLGAGSAIDLDSGEAWRSGGPTYGDPRLTPQRLGQQAFRAVVLRAYARRCAVTGDRIRPVLQAAHIRPLPAGGDHRLDNGLLLDVHTLYDRGYLGVDPNFRLLVSPRLRDEFGNGEQFYARAGTPIRLPDRRADRPNREFLEWHLDEVFKAS